MGDLVTYRGPFKGVDVSMPETDIDPTATPSSLNFFNYRNELRSRPKIITSGLTPNDFIRCFFLFNDINLTIQRVAISPTKIYTADGVTTIGTMAMPNNKETLSPVVYNGKLFWPSNNQLYSYDGTTFSNPASAFSGSYFINKIAAHLVLINTLEGINTFPQRVRWSASGLPTVLDPTVNTNAGYNDLDVAEALNGSFVSGNTLVITTPHSLIEMVPTGGGINPFAFYTVSYAPFGVGNYYLNSLDSFGIFTVFAAQDDIYLMSQVNGIKDIGGTARAAIYADLLQSSTPFDGFPFGGITGPVGTIINSYINNNGLSSDGLYYILAIPMGNVSPLNLGYVVFWVYDLKRNCWFRWQTPQSTYWLTSKYADLLLGSIQAGTYFFS